ncbi:MAG: 1,4-alpha-glucan branching protein GlgB [Clostridiales Family XIII bacterium]|jgi:1,4-alpha-glucan branching enzyme|nr:1,4-alpha-glucan branching protein GlgB [Clostridiales Family XIII bacterium]
MSTESNPFYLPDTEIDGFYAGTSVRAQELFGCVYLAEAKAYRFCVWAPGARSVSLVGDFNEWDGGGDVMEVYRGLWVRLTDRPQNGDHYKYRIEGADGSVVLKADPYARYAETAPETASKVWDTGGYTWRDEGYLKKRAETDIQHAPVSIYELHIGSWRLPEGCEFPAYRHVADELAVYVKDLGFTHVELMPINEYPFDGSWGYQVTGFFAITARFGTPQDFMYFVDRLHEAGIGVIVDWVPAHFPKDRHGLPHFDGSWLYEHADALRREHPQWGTYEFNYHRPEVKSFLISSALFLIEQYHIDGLRVDAVSSMLYLDYGREGAFIRNRDGGNIDYDAVDFLRGLNTAVLGGRPGVMTIAEESTSYPLVTRPPYAGGLGFTFKWNMGFMHDTLDYLKIDPYFRHGAHDKMTFSMYYAFSENFILPYSHDEVVHGKASMIGKMYGDYADKFSALRTLYGYLYGHPGKKLMFMGSEFAQFIEWDYKKELDWFLLDYEAHAGMRAWVRALNKLYRKESALYRVDDSWDGFQWLNVEDRRNNVFAFLRSDGDRHIVCVYNFSPVGHEGYHVALPRPGRLSLLLSSDEPPYAGKGSKVKSRASAKDVFLNGLPFAATLSVPPLSVMFYRYITTEKAEKKESDHHA